MQKICPNTTNFNAVAPLLPHSHFRIVLGITGGIAAYKSAVLARLLIKTGHSVRVVMTAAACEFITPLTFQALTGNAVHTALLDERAELGMGHIELAKWADVVLIAPACANTLGKLATGLADNLLTTVCMATATPIVVAPAMNQQMWANPILQSNLAKLAQAGYHIIPPSDGEQACGDVGAGRLPEPEMLYNQVLAILDSHFLTDDRPNKNRLVHSNTDKTKDKILPSINQSQTLTGKTVIITAGATIEPIDPVRYLSNHSTGKMGYAIAAQCINLGANVIIISGEKVALTTPQGAKRVNVTTADEMLSVCREQMTQHNPSKTIFIATAAVADYKVKTVATQKIKKTTNSDTMTLTLIKNPDILATISREFADALMIGFAAETENTNHYAQNKLITKNLDIIACNDVSDKSIGFGSDNNAMTVFFAEKYHISPLTLAKTSKQAIAKELIDCILMLKV